MPTGPYSPPFSFTVDPAVDPAPPIIFIGDDISEDDSVTANVIKSLVKYLPLAIKKSSGFFYDVKEANDIYKSVEEIRQYPAIDIALLNISYENIKSGGHSHRNLIKTLEFRLDCYLFLTGNIQLGQIRILRDMERFFMSPAFRRIPDVTDFNKHWAREVMFSSARPFSINSTKPNCGIEINISIFTAQDIYEPSIRT